MIMLSALGRFAPPELEDLADQSGMLPEAGDHWSEFDWPEELRARLEADRGWAEQWWSEYVGDAVRLTEEALEEMPENYDC